MKKLMELETVIQLLKRAEQLANYFCGGYCNEFRTTSEFISALKNSINLLRAGDTSQVRKLVQWFSPDSVWNNMVGPDGDNLGMELLAELEKLTTKRLRF